MAMDGASDDDGGGSSSDGSMDSCFELEDSDEDEARQRAMMAGAAGTSLAEAEARARKRSRDDVPLPGLAPVLPPMPSNVHRQRPVCAHCGEACRGTPRHTDARLASAADYGQDDFFMQHLGAFRGALQRLALAKLLADRLCPPEHLDALPCDLVEAIALTSACGRTRLLQQPARYDWGDCEPIYDDCLLIAIKSERHSTVKLLLHHLPAMFPSALTMVRPQTSSLRPTIQWGTRAQPITLLDAVAVLSVQTRAAPLFSMLWELLPATTPWEAAVWLRSLRLAGLTTPAAHRAELQPLYATIVGQFGAGGIGRDPAAEPVVHNVQQLFSGPEAVAGRQILPHAGAFRHILAPEALYAWTQHPFLRWNLCPYAQLLGCCPMACAHETCGGSAGCFMGHRLATIAHAPIVAAVEWTHPDGKTVLRDDGCLFPVQGLPRCACCLALEACQRRNYARAAAALRCETTCADGQAILEDYLSLPPPAAGNCGLWCDADSPTQLSLRDVETMFE